MIATAAQNSTVEVWCTRRWALKQTLALSEAGDDGRWFLSCMELWQVGERTFFASGYRDGVVALARADGASDVTRWDGGGRRFDFILVNSFFHHIDDADSRRILAHLATLLEPEGRIHVLALALPTRFDPAYALAKLDRGDHPRRLSAWRELFHVDYQVELFEPYPVGLPGVPLWNMVYFRGKAKPRG